MSRAANPRMRKVNELLREIIAEEAVELKDPGIGFLTITGVETAPDLRQAIVYYSVLGTPENEQATADALRRAACRLQAVIGVQARIKYTPVLEFRVDPAIEQGLRIDRILHDLETEGEEE